MLSIFISQDRSMEKRENERGKEITTLLNTQLFLDILAMKCISINPSLFCCLGNILSILPNDQVVLCLINSFV